MLADTTFSACNYKAQHIKDFFVGVKLREVRETDVERFLDYLFKEKDLSPRTARDIKAIFAEAFEAAKEDGLVVCNSVKKAKFDNKLVSRHTSEKNTDDEFFSYEEAQTFLKIARTHELKVLFYVTDM